MSTNQKMFSGLCAGGPRNEQMLAASATTVNVPILIPGQRGFSQISYTFNETIGVWVWQGPWPIDGIRRHGKES